jgi:translation initiation factor IF-1
MVKNTKGGSGNKKMARRLVNQAKASSKTRLANPKEPCEMYANVLKMYGQNCDVMCNDGIERICMIRKKFKGRNKRNNTIEAGTKVLVGLRDWEGTREGKKPHCDLMEVYDKKQHKDLMNDEHCNWDILLAEHDRPKKDSDEGFDFADNAEEYNEIMDQIQSESTKLLAVKNENGEDYSIDDI